MARTDGDRPGNAKTLSWLKRQPREEKSDDLTHSNRARVAPRQCSCLPRSRAIASLFHDVDSLPLDLLNAAITTKLL